MSCLSHLTHTKYIGLKNCARGHTGLRAFRYRQCRVETFPCAYLSADPGAIYSPASVDERRALSSGGCMDWNAPLMAIDLQSGTLIPVAIDPRYSRKSAGVPVRLPRNAWTGCPDSGTWYFDDDGLAIGGLSEDGYNGRYQLVNH